MDGGLSEVSLVRYASGPCKVCSYTPSSMHYGAMVCNGCKCFFRETVVSKRNRMCFVAGKCENPRRCKACRWQKCLDVGMKACEPSKSQQILRLKELEALQLKESSKKFLDLIAKIAASYPQCVPPDSKQVSTTLLVGRCHKIAIEPYSSSTKHNNVVAYLKGQQTHLSIDTTLNAVNSGFMEVFKQQMARQEAFMHDVTVNGNIPFQPEISLPAMLKNVVAGIENIAQEFCRFAFHLSGFRDLLSAEDQTALLKERWTGLWLIAHYRFEKNNKFYYRYGPRQVHYSNYWREQLLGYDYLTDYLLYIHCLQELNMSYVESFLFLTAELFYPENTSAKDKGALGFLYRHYSECLLHVLRSAPNGSSKSNVQREEQILKFRPYFRQFYSIANSYVTDMDLTKTPFRSSTGLYSRNTINLTQDTFS